MPAGRPKKLENMSLEELEDRLLQIRMAQIRKKDAAITALRAEMTAIAKAEGFSIKELFR